MLARNSGCGFGGRFPAACEPVAGVGVAPAIARDLVQFRSGTLAWCRTNPTLFMRPWVLAIAGIVRKGLPVWSVTAYAEQAERKQGRAGCQPHKDARSPGLQIRTEPEQECCKRRQRWPTKRALPTTAVRRESNPQSQHEGQNSNQPHDR